LEYFESEKEVIYRKKILPPIISNSDQNLESRRVPHKQRYFMKTGMPRSIRTKSKKGVKTMRKHKSVVAILLAVMMIFTFMPTMAFAQTGDGVTVKWADDFKSVTVSNATDSVTWYKIAYNWSNATGITLATVDTTGYDPASLSPLLSYAEPGTFYDLNSSHIARGTDDVVTSFAYGTFVEGYNNVTKEHYAFKVILDAPTYAANYNTTTIKSVVLNDSNVSKAVYADGFTVNNYAEQTVKLSATVVADGSGYFTSDVKLLGSVPEKTVTVAGMPADASQFIYGIDTLDEYTQPSGWNVTYHTSEDSGNKFMKVEGTYDGKAHKIVANSVPGYSLKFEVQDAKTKVWNVVDAVEFKDANLHYYEFYGDNSALEFRVTMLKNDKAVGSPMYGSVWVEPAEIYVDWDKSIDKGDRVVVPNDADPLDYIVTGALDSDKEEVMKFFSEVADINVTVNKADSTKEDWKIVEKNLTKAETEALIEQYKALFTNYYYEGATTKTAKVQRAAAPNVNTKDDDITFTLASNKTIKIKKAKKTKKAYSFAAVEASAKSGNAISYMLTTPNKKIVIDSATGKITVKKGLKKGTYKVTVKAVTEDGNGYKAAKESVKLTIKVKK
jgi:hypothetical protein